jgi:hypothetical protein
MNSNSSNSSTIRNIISNSDKKMYTFEKYKAFIPSILFIQNKLSSESGIIILSWIILLIIMTFIILI